MSAIPKRRYTMEEYIEIDKYSEERYEYFAGEILDMAGASLDHNQIVSNLILSLGNNLAKRPCRVLPADMRIKVPKALPYRYPDVVVVCGEPVIEAIHGMEMLINPSLIIEVLSPTTEAYDRGDKFHAYQSVESFQEYLLVSQDKPYVTRYVRQPEGAWLRSDIEGIESEIKLSSLGFAISLGEIYRSIDFSNAEETV
jgi:Uma2 family endonuclease